MPLTLAIEWSTRRLSVATRDPARPETLHESSLQIERFQGPAALELLETHLKNSTCQKTRIAKIVIGRGPGNFSGIRLAFAWAAGWMAPGGLTLETHSSGRILAERLQRTLTHFWVLGDARRGQWWGCRVTPDRIYDWELQPPEVWQNRMGEDPVYSSEADRLRGRIEVREAFPKAADLLTTRLKPEAGAPLYLHPAV